MNLPASVEIIEVGPRDGLQKEAPNVSTSEKISLIEALTAAGLGRFGATSFVSLRAIPQLADPKTFSPGSPREAWSTAA